jgi:hypothetical protein
MSIKKVLSSRLNYDWIGLATAILGFLLAADLSWLPPRWAGAALLGLGIANVVLAWYRAQLHIGGQKSLAE